MLVREEFGILWCRSIGVILGIARITETTFSYACGFSHRSLDAVLDQNMEFDPYALGIFQDPPMPENCLYFPPSQALRVSRKVCQAFFVLKRSAPGGLPA